MELFQGLWLEKCTLEVNRRLVETYILDLQEKNGIPDDASKGTEAGPRNHPAIQCNTAGFLPCES